VFRRSKTTEATAPTTLVKEGGKGRPTPSRKEAEAARKARVKLPQDKKAAAKLLRERRAEGNAKMREGMKTGEERYLPARDKGPVRRFVRDWVDSRLSMAEFLLPLLLVIMVSRSFNPALSNGLWQATILVVALDTVFLVYRLRRELRRRFPEQSTKGAVRYALMRALQLRWLRLPKSQVKLGTKLPERY
jgi:hypothetical protein